MRLCYEMRMDFSNIEQRRIFFEIHEGLPRQSPGSTLSTLKALDLVAGVLTETPFIADMACGPGASALVLGTALPHAKIIGVDLHQPFLDEFAARARREDLQERIETHCGDMLEPLPDAGACELIWCEGGIYNVGVGAGLLAWRNSLKPGGLVVFNEVVWLVDEDARADPVRDFWRAYPSMTDIAGVESAVESADYELLGGFNLPESDWCSRHGFVRLRQSTDRARTLRPQSPIRARKLTSDAALPMPIIIASLRLECAKNVPRWWHQLGRPLQNSTNRARPQTA